MNIIRNIAIASLLALAAPALAKSDPIRVTGYPLNFETGAGAGQPITLYKQQDALAFVVIDSIASDAAWRITVGHNASPTVGAWLPLRRGESITLKLAQAGAIKLKAHVMVVKGYLS